MKIETIQSQTVLKGRVFDVRQDQVRLPNGQLVQLEIVDHPGAVVLVPVDTSGNIWLIEQYRHAAGENLIELPAGVAEPGESIEECAFRELREETGMSANSLQRIGEFYIAPGYSTEYLIIFLATELSVDPLTGDEDEFIQVKPTPIDQVFALAESGQIRDAKSLAALLLALPYIK
jgi:ADP-ribose pyrophosphatase